MSETEIQKALSKDWFRPMFCKKVREELQSYTLNFLITVKENNVKKSEVFSGFLYKDENENLLWITAGHVIDNIKKIKSPIRARWLDNFDKKMC